MTCYVILGEYPNHHSSDIAEVVIIHHPYHMDVSNPVKLSFLVGRATRVYSTLCSAEALNLMSVATCSG